MSAILGFCENPECGAIFEVPNFISGSGMAIIEFENTTVGSCPSCGGSGKILDGVYHYSNRVIDFLTGPKSSVELIRKIQTIVTNSVATSKDELLQEIEKESPEASEVFRSIPSTSNLPQWLAVIVAILSLAYSIYANELKTQVTPGPDYRDQFIERLLEHDGKEQLLRHWVPKPNIPRESECPCGSGKKYKECCGDPGVV